MTSPTKREEPPFVSDEQITNSAFRHGRACRANDLPEKLVNERQIAYVHGGSDVRDLYEAELSRLRTEQEAKPRAFTEDEVCMMLRDTLSAALKNRLALDSTSIRQEAEQHIAEHYGLNIFNT